MTGGEAAAYKIERVCAHRAERARDHLRMIVCNLQIDAPTVEQNVPGSPGSSLGAAREFVSARQHATCGRVTTFWREMHRESLRGVISWSMIMCYLSSALTQSCHESRVSNG
jgi:hypothetical protein